LHDDENDQIHTTTFDHFVGEGLITHVIRPIKAGKEATVHLVRTNPSTTGERLGALKAFHSLERRDFRDESVYRDGEWIRERRIRVALQKRTKLGREVQGGIWVNREWEALRLLWAAGLPVPRPIARTSDAILMTLVGDEVAVAPQLRSCRPTPAEAEDLFGQLMRAIKGMLFHNVVHGDLSPYNILWWERRATIIDLPQAADPRKNRHARSLLERDVGRVCEYASRWGVERHPERIASDLWTAWEFADLVPEELRALVDPI